MQSDLQNVINQKDLFMNKLKKYAAAIFTVSILFSCAAPAGSEDVTVEIKTTLGDIIVKLYDDTPVHRDNFLKLVNSGYFEGISFHRVIQNFMIQAGDPSTRSGLSQEELDSLRAYTIPSEFRKDHFHKKGALAAARQGNNINPEMRSSGTQFYIVQGTLFTREDLEASEKQIDSNIKQAEYTRIVSQITDSIRLSGSSIQQGEILDLANTRMYNYLSNIGDFRFTEEQLNTYQTIGGVPRLDGTYTVFGEVVEGLDVVDKIAGVPTGERDKPLTDVNILKMRVVRK